MQSRSELFFMKHYLVLHIILLSIAQMLLDLITIIAVQNRECKRHFLRVVIEAFSQFMRLLFLISFVNVLSEVCRLYLSFGKLVDCMFTVLV